MTDYDILGSSSVLVGCLAKRKHAINRRVRERLDMEQFDHFGSVFVKEDRETGKVVQKPCLLTRQSATRQSQRLRLCHTIKRILVRRNRTCDINLWIATGITQCKQ